MRAIVVCTALLLGCGADGAGGPPFDAGTPFVPSDPSGIDNGHAVDDQSGAERGTVGTFGRCTRDSECKWGSCLRVDERVGFCITFCAAPLTASIAPFRVEPCPSGEQCVIVEEGLGICSTPCTSSRDCGAGRCSTFRRGTPGTWCGPGGVSEETPAPPSESG